MCWSIGGRSSNLEDRPGQRFGGMGIGRLGVGGVVILLVLSLFFKEDFFGLVSGGTGEAAAAGPLKKSISWTSCRSSLTRRRNAVGCGSPSTASACATNARCAVGHDDAEEVRPLVSHQPPSSIPQISV
jgi:predicted metalloprotease